VGARRGCERLKKVIEDLYSDQDAVYGSDMGRRHAPGCFDARW
jgi:hypothetical protein